MFSLQLRLAQKLIWNRHAANDLDEVRILALLAIVSEREKWKCITSLPVSSLEIIGGCVLDSLKVTYPGKSSYLPTEFQITHIHNFHISVGYFDPPIAQYFTEY